MSSNETSYCLSTEVLLRRTKDEESAYFSAFLYFYIIIAVTSTILNALVIATLMLSKDLHGTFYKILSSLFVSDLITGALIFPMLAGLNATYDHPDCVLISICQYLVHTISLASILSMMAIAYDRYLRVSKRHTYSTFMTKRRGYVIVASIWISSPIIGALSTFLQSKVIAITALFVIGTILTLYVITVKKLRTNVNQISDDLTARQKAVQHDGGVRRSSRLVFILVLVMLLSWCPSIVISMMSDRILYSTNEYFITGIQQLPLLSAVTSPFLYFWTNKTTRRSFVSFCFKMCCKKTTRENDVTKLT
eukprot:Seg4483.2 transcript_id=Seg4483.2/GoldUCD/mRNA.D3Y31 product="Adenosine receptor A1" protein_id=Seg4483.2/GoldUCD/D3Y31